jgi:hypothetical protein
MFIKGSVTFDSAQAWASSVILCQGSFGLEVVTAVTKKSTTE